MSGKKMIMPSRGGKDISSMKKPEKESEAKIHLKSLKSNQQTNIALIHLDRAEKLTLDLLKVCASTCDHLSDLAQIDEGRTSNGSTNKDGSTTSSTIMAHEMLVMEKQNQIQENGNEFRSKIQEIYDLLAPHAKLLQNYNNMSQRVSGKKHLVSRTTTSTVEEGKEEKPTEKKTGENDDDNKEEENDQKKEMKKEIHFIPINQHNVYSSRLELRLATDHCELLKKMLASLTKEKEKNIMDHDDDGKESFKKRKHGLIL